MTTAELLTTIQAAGITFTVERGGLRCKPKPTGELLELIRAHKAELMALSIATLTANLPDDPTLRAEVHRLLNAADELDRAGDEAGMVRILDNIERLTRKHEAAQAAVEAPRNDRVGKDEVTAATAPYNAPNAKVGDNAGNTDSVPVCGAGPAITPPSDHADVVSERAAILEFDGGMTRVTAEREAVQEVGPCFLCGGGRFWVSRWGVIVCERCHPPADTKLIERSITANV